MNWTPIRTRPIYREMKTSIETALANYWEASAKGTHIETLTACEEVTLSAYRLLQYIRTEYGGINDYVEDKNIKSDVTDACTGFYCLGEGESTSFQEESDVLEILSRSAYREMKLTQKAIDELRELDQRIERD